MSEKRFSFGAVSPNVCMIMDNGQGLDVGEIVNLLNSLSQQVESLQEENESLKQALYETSEEYKIQHAKEIIHKMHKGD